MGILSGVSDKKRVYDFMLGANSTKSCTSIKGSDYCFQLVNDLKKALGVDNILCIGL